MKMVMKAVVIGWFGIVGSKPFVILKAGKPEPLSG